jgi:hypothetical protein
MFKKQQAINILSMFNFVSAAEFFRSVAEKLCKGIRHQQQMAVGITLAYVRCKYTTTDGHEKTI